MFRGTVDRPSHEGGLLVAFNGSSPSLGAIIVREEDGHYIGKVDAVIGSTEAPLAHVAHLDRNQDNDAFLGATVTIRAKKEREERPRREQRNEQRNERSFDRRDNRRGNDSQKSDWICASCENVNFAWRTECNSCGKGKDGNVKGYKSSFRDNDRSNDRRDRSRQENHGRNDWECPSCNNINFSFRTECNQCGKPKAGGGGRQGQSRGGFSNRSQRGGRDSDRRGGDRDGRRSFGGNRGGRDSDRRGGDRDGRRSFGGNRGGRDSDRRG
ncbi:MAG: zinc finger protein, partial [Candidatus Poseidoniaceae archaeon]